MRAADSIGSVIGCSSDRRRHGSGTAGWILIILLILVVVFSSYIMAWIFFMIFVAAIKRVEHWRK